MGEEEQFNAVVRSLYAAMLDTTAWSETARLIDEVCGVTCNALLVGEGTYEDAVAHFVGLRSGGQRLLELEREYLECYLPIDERVPRFRRLGDGRVVHVTDLYLDHELRTSPTYNEFHGRAGGQDGLNVRLDGPNGSDIAWVLGDPVSADGWGAASVGTVERLLPHVRQLILVRQALGRVGAMGRLLAEHMEDAGVGVILLNKWGRIVNANGVARKALRLGDGLVSKQGVLTATAPVNRKELARLLKKAVPQGSDVAAGGSMVLRSASLAPWKIVHVAPVTAADMDFGGEGVGAMVLAVEPGRRLGISTESVAMALGLTPAQSQVAVLLAEGKTVREIARTTGRKESSVYSLVKQIYRKLGISRQVDLVRLVSGL